MIKEETPLLKEQSLNYKPDIKYTDDYYTDIESIKDLNQEDIDDIVKPEIPLIDLDSTDNIIGLLPGDISNIVEEVFGPIKDIWDSEMKDKEYSKIPSLDDYHYEIKDPDDLEDDKDNGNGNDFDEDITEDDFLDADDDIVIVPEDNEILDIIDKEYIKNMTDIIDDYNSKLNNSLANFWIGVTVSFKEDSFKPSDYIWNKIKYKSSEIRNEYKHILDYILTRENTRDIKIDFYNNLFNIQSTVTHLKQVKVCYELRKRYASIETENTQDKKNDGMNDNILNGVNIMYDIKYDKALENLYRYLDSSVVIFDDILKTQLQEIKSKNILLKGKGVK